MVAQYGCAVEAGSLGFQPQRAPALATPEAAIREAIMDPHRSAIWIFFLMLVTYLPILD